MRQITRAMIAAAAAEQVAGRPVERLYDHSRGEVFPVTKHVPRATEETLVLYVDLQERVSLQVHDDLFSGWDHLTGAYFAGAMVESDVMLYDGYEGRYYKFSIH